MIPNGWTFSGSRLAEALVISTQTLFAVGCMAVEVESAGARTEDVPTAIVTSGQGCRDLAVSDPAVSGVLRIGQYNLKELNRAKLDDPANPQVVAASQIIGCYAPDLLSINELQFDIPAELQSLARPGQRVEGAQDARLLAERVHAANSSLGYPYTFVALGNSGFAWEGNGAEAGELPEEFQLRGFGRHQRPGDNPGVLNGEPYPGQFNVALLSRFPILDQVRVEVDFAWEDLPDNSIEAARRKWQEEEDNQVPHTPSPLLDDEGSSIVPPGFPLFEKGLVIVPVDVLGETLWVILFHPVTGGFGDLNPYRNYDELHALALFLDGQLPGVEPLPEGARFVVIGDLNADPEDGDGLRRDTDPGPAERLEGATSWIYRHPALLGPDDHDFPMGDGGRHAETGAHGERNSFLSGCGGMNEAPPWNPKAGPRNPNRSFQMQLDYILPSRTAGSILRSRIHFPYWDGKDDAVKLNVLARDEFNLACRASDHRFMWLDLQLAAEPIEPVGP